jgi:hypothetical protein
MKYWRFMDYCSEAGNDLIEEWYLDQDAEVRADFDVTLRNLAGTHDWHGLNEFKMLHGKQGGFGEIRFKTRNVQYRPIGRFGPNKREFTLLVGCHKKQRVYEPPDALDLAVKRWNLYTQGRASIRERSI